MIHESLYRQSYDQKTEFLFWKLSSRPKQQSEKSKMTKSLWEVNYLFLMEFWLGTLIERILALILTSHSLSWAFPHKPTLQEEAFKGSEGSKNDFENQGKENIRRLRIFYEDSRPKFDQEKVLDDCHFSSLVMEYSGWPASLRARGRLKIIIFSNSWSLELQIKILSLQGSFSAKIDLKFKV